MTKEAIVEAALKLETTHDLLVLLNKIKMSELGVKGYPFTMPHLNYFIHPARNRKSYKTFYIPKKSGGVREISAPRKLLKSFLTYTNRLLQAFYDAPSFVTGFVPEKSVVDNAEFHIGRNYVFNTDLKDFFPSITKSRVWATLKHPPFSFNDIVADAIAGLCCTEMEIDGEKQRILPQGSPCSPILTNIVCRNLDRKLYKLAKEFDLRYSRYADDITFSGDKDVFQKGDEFRHKLEAIIAGEHFTFNEKKTRLQTKNQRQEVTGLVVNDKANVTKDYVRGLDNLLYIWEKYGEEQAYFRFIAHYAPKHNFKKGRKPDMRSVIRGKLQYLKMVKGADNEVWRRLQRRYNKLTGTKSPTVDSNIKFCFRIKDFEKKSGTSVDFKTDEKGIVRCSFTLNDKCIPVALSRYVRTRITNILSDGETKELDTFKSHFIILLYERQDGNMWRIERARKSSTKNEVKSASEVFKELSLNTPLNHVHRKLIIEKEMERAAKSMLIVAKEDWEVNSINEASKKIRDELALSPIQGKNADEVLAKLVEYDDQLNLNALDEWDKIKSS